VSATTHSAGVGNGAVGQPPTTPRTRRCKHYSGKGCCIPCAHAWVTSGKLMPGGRGAALRVPLMVRRQPRALECLRGEGLVSVAADYAGARGNRARRSEGSAPNVAHLVLQHWLGLIRQDRAADRAFVELGSTGHGPRTNVPGAGKFQEANRRATWAGCHCS
jgi:hypothetical protein